MKVLTDKQREQEWREINRDTDVNGVPLSPVGGHYPLYVLGNNREKIPYLLITDRQMDRNTFVAVIEVRGTRAEVKYTLENEDRKIGDAVRKLNIMGLGGDTAYIDYHGGTYNATFLSEGQSYRYGTDEDKANLLARLKRSGFKKIVDLSKDYESQSQAMKRDAEIEQFLDDWFEGGVTKNVS